MLKRVVLLLVIAFLLQFSPPAVKASLQTTCTTTDNSATGLIATPIINGSFGTSADACILDNAATFAPFKLPTYDDLKSLYYTQAKSQVRKTPVQGSPSQGEFTSAFTQNDVVLVNGDLPDVNYTGTSKTSIVFVEGNLAIAKNLTYGDDNSGLVFVVKGEVYIDPSVTQIDAVIISADIIYTAAANNSSCDSNSVTATSPLTINGSLVNLDSTKGVKYCRYVVDATGTSQAGEIINQQPKYLVLLRNLFSDTLQRWSEIDASVPVPTAAPAPAATVQPSPTASPSPTPDPNLAGLWLMDETSGNLLDSSGNNHTLTPTGTFSVDGLSGKARSFSVNGDVITGFPGFDKSTPTTFNLWFKTTVGGEIFQQSYYNPNSSWTCATNTGWFDLLPTVRTDNGNVQIWAYGACWQGLPRNDLILEATGDYRDGQWHMLTIIIDGANNTGYGYLDGISLGSDTFTDIGSWSANQANSLKQIGKTCHYPWQTCSYNYFNGTIDELSMYNRRLSDNEITALHDAGKDKATNVGLWHMDETSGTTVIDSSIYGSNGTYTGTSSVNGIDGNARNISGNNLANYISLPATNFGTGDFTVELWVQRIGGQSSSASIFSKYCGGSGPCPNYDFIIEFVDITPDDGIANATHIQVRAYNDAQTSPYFLTGPVINTDQNWNHVALVRNGSTGKLYYNSREVYTGDISMLNVNNIQNNFYIGRYSAAETWDPDKNFNVDEVKIYNVARTLEEIQADYDAEKEKATNVGLWHMDNNWNDSSIYGNNAASSGATFSTTAVAGGYAGNFDGSSDYIGVSSYSTLAYPKTFSFWFKTETFDNWRPLIREKNGTLIRILNNQHKFDIWSILPSSSTTAYYANPSLAFTPNQPTHVAVVLTANNAGTIYVNGVAETLSFSSVTTGTADPQTGNLLIGAGDNRYYNGLIDEVKIYNTARTDSEILYDFQNPSVAGVSTSFSKTQKGFLWSIVDKLKAVFRF